MSLLATSKTFTSKDFKLTTGAVLPEVTLAYETWGKLNADGSNGILLCHGYTSHPHAGGDGGWFANLMGPGKAVDTDKYFVVCSNMLGSSYGSTGPGSIDPKTGQPYGPDFPAYSARDMVAAQERLIDHLGIKQMAAVIGYSYGGHLTFLWGVMRPDRMRALVPIAGVMERANTAATVAALRKRFETTCPGWNGGRYYGKERMSGVRDLMVTIRKETLANYGIGKHLEDTKGAAARDETIAAMAETWADHFDANSLIKLPEARIGSSAVPDAGAMKAPLLCVLADTDSVVAVAEGHEIEAILKGHGVDARFLELVTDYGHAGPMIDADKWSDDLRAFLARTN
jgi:homoserine O-acetyltransferase